MPSESLLAGRLGVRLSLALALWFGQDRVQPWCPPGRPDRSIAAQRRHAPGCVTYPARSLWNVMGRSAFACSCYLDGGLIAGTDGVVAWLPNTLCSELAGSGLVFIPGKCVTRRASGCTPAPADVYFPPGSGARAAIDDEVFCSALVRKRRNKAMTVVHRAPRPAGCRGRLVFVPDIWQLRDVGAQRKHIPPPVSRVSGGHLAPMCETHSRT